MGRKVVGSKASNNKKALMKVLSETISRVERDTFSALEEHRVNTQENLDHIVHRMMNTEELMEMAIETGAWAFRIIYDKLKITAEERIASTKELRACTEFFSLLQYFITVVGEGHVLDALKEFEKITHKEGEEVRSNTQRVLLRFVVRGNEDSTPEGVTFWLMPSGECRVDNAYVDSPAENTETIAVVTVDPNKFTALLLKEELIPALFMYGYIGVDNPDNLMSLLGSLDFRTYIRSVNDTETRDVSERLDAGEQVELTAKELGVEQTDEHPEGARLFGGDYAGPE